MAAASLRTKHQLRLLLQQADEDVDAGEERTADVVEGVAMPPDAAALPRALLSLR